MTPRDQGFAQGPADPAVNAAEEQPSVSLGAGIVVAAGLIFSEAAASVRVPHPLP